MGLLSDGGVHSHYCILDALLHAAQMHQVKTVFIHAFLDGRDVPPQSAATYLTHLDHVCKKYNKGILGSIQGRFYAMDRDKHWDRTQKSYEVLTEKHSLLYTSWNQALYDYYNQKITDEFIPPTQLDPESIVNPGDGIIFFNIRADRARQLTQAFTDPSFHYFPIKKIPLSFFATMTDYDHQKLHATLLTEPLLIKNTLKEVLQQHHKTIFSIAETEKYAHVTYFFDGGREQSFLRETRIMIPSLITKSYAFFPAMSAQKITDTVIQSLTENPCDFYLINYSNADMVGHSGDFQATKKAIECLDDQLGQLYKEIVLKRHGTLYITADHGNAEIMFDKQINQPHTAHTKNPVYFLMIKHRSEHTHLPSSLKGLSDIAPFILSNMGLPIPDEMIH
jgi:2,3-bisphosphoglycerate-independent phosphoglycerate mutase